MTSKDLGRLTRGSALLLVALFVPLGAGASAGCGDTDSCKSTREQTYASLATWQECDPGDVEACILEPGNPRDCSGVLTCEFAVNARYRTEAEEAMMTIPEQTRGCNLCSTPSCLSGTSAYCEPTSRRCMIGGITGVIVGEQPDAGSPIVTTDDASADGP